MKIELHSSCHYVQYRIQELETGRANTSYALVKQSVSKGNLFAIQCH